jgi:hypothetical protein
MANEHDSVTASGTQTRHGRLFGRLRSASVGRLFCTHRHGRSVEDTRGRLFGTHRHGRSVEDTRMA